MDDLKANLLTFAILFGGSQLFCFLLDLIKWAVRRKHPARIAKSEDVSYPQYLTVSVWHDSHLAHRYIEYTYIRKGNNKYKKYIKRSIGGWIGIILIDLFWLVLIFGLPVAGLICAPDKPHPEFYVLSVILFFFILHAHLSGPDTIARIELNKYLKSIAKAVQKT